MNIIQTNSILIGCIFLANCGQPSQVERDAKVIAAQKGRWQLVPANPPYPAIVFDTVTGCAEPIYVKDKDNLIRAGMIGQEDICDLPTAQRLGPDK